MEAIREIEGEDFTFRSRDRRESELIVEQKRKPFVRMPFIGGRYR